MHRMVTKPMQTESKPQMDERIRGHEGLGLISLYEGHGKGKSTAALGTAIRAMGAGLNVAIIYFDKGGEHYFEREMLKKCPDLVDVHATGRDRIDPVTGRFDFGITEEDKAEGKRGLGIVQAIFTQDKHQLVILDEINSSADLGIVEEADVLALLAQKPEHVEVLLTGRDAPQSFKDAAHLVTEMTLKKHYFYSGVKAREGIDF